MRDYFIRRFLLIPPTLLGITLIAFFITRIVPGGPIERALAESGMMDMAGGRSGGGESAALSEEQLDHIDSALELLLDCFEPGEEAAYQSPFRRSEGRSEAQQEFGSELSREAFSVTGRSAG